MKAQAEIYILLVTTRSNLEAAYAKNFLEMLREGASKEALDMLLDEYRSVIDELNARIQAHPLHDVLRSR